jgi:alpha-mannosidase
MGNKKVYFQKQNHMDVTWRRCWDKSAFYRGSVIRPYSQLEELILNRDIELIKKENSYVTSIEQAITIRKYLERNPDKLPLIKELIWKKNIELLNGGETVIDYNMVNGESIVRNFLYSINWYEREFNVRNSSAIVIDTFGVSGQMPQILRKLGLDYITQIGRVFENKKSFWKGIDGTIICFKDPTKGMEEKSAFISLESYTKYYDCSVCKGSGCKHCNFTGLDTASYRFSDATLINSSGIKSVGMAADPLKRALEYAKDCPYEEVYIYLSSEEILQDDMLVELINEYRTKYSMDISFMTKDEEFKKGTADLRELLKNSPEAIKTEDIDERNEGNCVCTGCYVSRIKLKQLIREAEGHLITAEKLAVWAKIYGMETYPLKKIERLWNGMSFAQFHDAITSSHIDEAYYEILDCLQNITLGSEQICSEATGYLNGLIDMRGISEGQHFVLYNALSWERAGIHSVVLQLENEVYGEYLEIFDEIGNRQHIVETTIHELTDRHMDIFKKRNSVEVKFTGSSIPAMGYRVFTFRYNNSKEKALANVECPEFLENEYYKIFLDEYGVIGIFDKELGKDVCTYGTNDLYLEEDFGSPWETLARPFNCTRLRKKNKVTGIKKHENRMIAIIEGSYTEKEDLYNGGKEENKLSWRQTITLYPKIKRIDFKMEVDWDTHSRRLKVAFPLGFTSDNDEAWYEIPYAAICRKKYEGSFGIHTNPNGDWPALNWVEVYNKQEDYSVTLLNKGLPCHKVENGVIYLSVLRSPEIPVYIYDFEDARDVGRHIFEHSIYSHKGSLEQGNQSKMGYELNMPEKSSDKFVNTKKCYQQLFHSSNLKQIVPLLQH